MIYGIKVDVLVGSIGVGILLVAFTLNMSGALKCNSKIYLIMNIIGGYLSCYASVLINYVPFVILEGTWAASAFVRLIIVVKRDYINLE
ncbi:MAG: hypothetical protein ABIC04_00030 [Nanoarchaeota archaeon]